MKDILKPEPINLEEINRVNPEEANRILGLCERDDNVWKYVEKIQARVQETEENFIIETIKPYCEFIIQAKISKRVLKQALMEYVNNHPDRNLSEWEDDYEKETD